MFSENNITTNGSLHYTAQLLIDLTLGVHLKILGKDEGYVQKWHLRYKTRDIYETKQSRAKVTTECL